MLLRVFFVVNHYLIIKIGKKTDEQKEVIDELNKFRDYIEMLSDVNYDAKQNKTEGPGLKISPKQMLQRSPIALAEVKAGTNSESLLNEIR